MIGLWAGAHVEVLDRVMGKRSRHFRKKRNKRAKKLQQKLLERRHQIRWIKIGTEEWKNAPTGTVIGYSVPEGTTPEVEAALVKSLKERSETINKSLFSNKIEKPPKKKKPKLPKAIYVPAKQIPVVQQEPRLSKRQRKKRNKLLHEAQRRKRPQVAEILLEEIPVKPGEL